MAATADVILSINSKLGPGGLASLQAGIGMLGRLGAKVISGVKNLQTFSQAFNNLQTDISELEKRGAGLIDTLDGIQGANKLVLGGLEASSHELANVGVIAGQYAQKLGTGKEGATRAYNELINALAGGRTFTLKKFGLQLSESGDKADVFAEAMRQIAEQVDGVSLKLRTLDEQWGAFTNNLETAAGLIDVWAGSMQASDGILGTLNESVGYFTAQLIESDGALLDFITSSDGARLTIEGMGFQAANSLGIMGDWTAAIEANAEASGKLLRLHEQLGQQRAKNKKAAQQLQSESAALSAARSNEKQLIKAIDSAAVGSDNQMMLLGLVRDFGIEMAAELAAEAEFSFPERVDKERTGGGGGRGKRKDQGVFIPRASSAGPSQMGGVFEGDPELGLLGAGVDQATVDDLFGTASPEILQETLDLLTDVQTVQAEIQSASSNSFATRQQEWEIERAEKQQQIAFDQDRANWEAEYHDIRISRMAELLGIEQEYVTRSRAQWDSGLQGKLQTSAVFFQSFAKLNAIEGKKAFNVAKASNYALNVITTALGMMKAYQSLAGIPYVGPALGIAAAAAVGAAGAAAGNKIRSQTYEGGAGGGGSTSIGMPSTGGGNYPSGAGQPGGPSTGGAGQGAQPVNITVTLEGGIEGWLDAAIDEDGKRGRLGEVTLGGGGVG